MGSKYTTLSTSGYNSSAPADDGSQTASNLVTWAGVKTKLSDPVKNLADSVNTALVTAFDYSVRQITGADSIVASDHMKTVEIASTVSSTVSITLGDAATLTSNFVVRIKNSANIFQYITRATGADTIDGTAGVIAIFPGESITLCTTTGANGFLIIGRSFPKSDSWTPSVGGTATYTTQIGRYLRIGRWCTVQCKLVINSIGTGSTTTISGLPFPSNDNSAIQTGSVSYFASLATNVLNISCLIPNNTSTVQFPITTAAGATCGSAAGAIFGNSAEVNFSITYETSG